MSKFNFAFDLLLFFESWNYFSTLLSFIKYEYIFGHNPTNYLIILLPTRFFFMTRTFLFLPVNKSFSSPLFKVSNVFIVSFKIFWFIYSLIYLLTLFNVGGIKYVTSNKNQPMIIITKTYTRLHLHIHA